MIFTELWFLTSQGLEKDEMGVELTRGDWEIKHVLINVSEIMYALKEIEYLPGCTVYLRNDTNLTVNISLEELNERIREYNRENMINTFFSKQ